MNQEIADVLFDNDARVARICHLGYMSLGEVEETLQELIEDFQHTLGISTVLGLDNQEDEWFHDASTAEEAVQLLIDLGKTGFLIEISGDIYEQDITDPKRYVRTAGSTSEIAYAPTADDIDQAILGALERLKPRLRRRAKNKKSD